MEDQGGTIDAVSETSFLRAVIKHVTKMGGTSGTEDLSHWHHLRPVHLPGDVVLSLVVVVWLVTLQITVVRLTRSVPRRKQTESEFWKKVTKTFQKTVSFSLNIEFMKDDTQITI